MTSAEKLLIVAVVILLALLVLSLVLHAVRSRQLKKIARDADEYLKSGKLTEFSVGDDAVALVRNSVADLENAVETEKNHTAVTAKKNSEFISDVSHQLKTPLAGIRLYCEMQNADNPTQYTQKELVLIERMENLIQRLLRLEKIRADSYAMEYKDNSLAEIINELFSEFRHLFYDREYIVSGDAMMRCDRAWMREAFGNIIKNACEHTESGGVIKVNIEKRDNSVTVEISDNGGGVKQREIPNLFKRFFRSDNANPGSAGIGLAITKEIVEKHHGIINAENKNSGLCITMCFPVIDGYKAM